MRVNQKAIWIVGSFLLLPCLSWAQETEKYNILLEGRYWYPKLNSTVKIVENQIGTDINLVDDLGFDAEKGFGEGRLQIKVLQYHKFNFSYLPMKWEGDKIISQNIQFSGQTYPAGTRVQSEGNL